MESFNLGQNNIINAYGFIKLFYNSYPEDIYPFNTSNNKIKLNLNINNTQTINHTIIKNDNYIFVLTERIFTNVSTANIYLTIYFTNIFFSIPSFIIEKYKPSSIIIGSKKKYKFK